MMTPAMLTGKSTKHLRTLYDQYQLHIDVIDPFLALQQAAHSAGFNLQPASAFRDFSRQQAIWNSKFSGNRPVMDTHGHPFDISSLSEKERCVAILRWSALPGASRHHWGSDIDIYDPDLLPQGQRLQLDPWEYSQQGYFAALTTWLDQNIKEFGFYRPFIQDHGGVAPEPWHLSYSPVAHKISPLLTPDILICAWQGQEIAGRCWLMQHIDAIFAQYIHERHVGEI